MTCCPRFLFLLVDALSFIVYRFGPRFPEMSGCYDKGLRFMTMEVAKQLGVASITQEGVYAMVGGPNFESVSEARLLHQLGVDAVGKNTLWSKQSCLSLGLSSEVQILRSNLILKQNKQL